MKSKSRIHATALIYEKNKALLVYENYINKWLLPGGTLEQNETLEQCLKRELKEELSINIFNEQVVDVYIHDFSKGIAQIVVVYRCDRKNSKIQINKDEISRYQWFTKDGVKKLDIHPQEKKIIINNYEEKGSPK